MVTAPGCRTGRLTTVGHFHAIWLCEAVCVREYAYGPFLVRVHCSTLLHVGILNEALCGLLALRVGCVQVCSARPVLASCGRSRLLLMAAACCVVLWAHCADAATCITGAVVLAVQLPRSVLGERCVYVYIEDAWPNAHCVSVVLCAACSFHPWFPRAWLVPSPCKRRGGGCL